MTSPDQISGPEQNMNYFVAPDFQVLALVVMLEALFSLGISHPIFAPGHTALEILEHW